MGRSSSKSTAREGERIHLRLPDSRDRAPFMALRRASRDHLEPWEPIPSPPHVPFSDDDFDRFSAAASTDRSRRLLVCANDGGRIVGQVSLGEVIRGPLQQCFMGYWLGHEFTGRGYMTEGVRLATDIAFEDMRLHRVEVNIQPHNAASRRVAQRVGYRLEGFSPRYLRIAGAWADHERWAMTLEEWGARR